MPMKPLAEGMERNYPKVYGDCPYTTDGKYCLGSWNRPVGIRQIPEAPHKLNDALLAVEEELAAYFGRRYHGFGACIFEDTNPLYLK